MEFDMMWEKVKKGLKDGAALSIEKIEEYTKLGKLKIEEFSAKRKIERNFVDIGERVFELIEDNKCDDISADILITGAVDSIRKFREELEEIDREIREETDKSSVAVDNNEEEEVTGI